MRNAITAASPDPQFEMDQRCKRAPDHLIYDTHEDNGTVLDDATGATVAHSPGITSVQAVPRVGTSTLLAGQRGPKGMDVLYGRCTRD